MIKKPLLRKFDNIADEISGGISQFFKKNVWALSLALLAGIYVNGFDITNVTFSIDEEFFFTSGHFGAEWLTLERWGLYLLSRIVPMVWYPFISQLVGLIFMVLAAVLVVSKYDKISTGAKLIFCVLVATSPVFAYMAAFSTQIAYFGVAAFIAVASYEMFAKGAAKGGNKWWLLPSLICLTFATGSYQSFLLLFLMPLIIDNLIKYVYKETDITSVIKITIYAVIFMLIAFVCHNLIIKIIGMQTSEYTSNFLYWSWSNIFPTMQSALSQVYRMVVGSHQYPLLTIFATFALFFSLPRILILQKDFTFKNMFKVLFLILLFIGSAASLQVALGGWIPTRILVNVTFFFAGSIFIYYLVGSKIEKLLICVFVVFSIFYHGSVVTRLFFSNYIATEADKVVATRVLDKIYDIAPDFYYGKTPVAFIGRHDYMKRSQAIKDNDVSGSSFWTWDNGNPARMIRFMQVMSGLPMQARLANEEEYAKARKYSETMPAWPAKDSVQLHDGVVVVKFAKQMSD